jgi:hypothetical protein
MNLPPGPSGVSHYGALAKTRAYPSLKNASSGRPNGTAGTKRDTVALSSSLTLSQIQDHLKTAIGEKVAGLFAEAGIEPAEAAGVDFSPEATAGRIVDFSTGLFEIFKDQNRDLSQEEVIDKFEATLRGAVDEGAGQAFAIIGATLGEDALSIGRQTIDLVHSKYDDFFASLRGEGSETSQAA